MSLGVPTFAATARAVSDAIAQVPPAHGTARGSASGPFATSSVTPAAHWSRSSTTSLVRVGEEVVLSASAYFTANSVGTIGDQEVRCQADPCKRGR